MSEAENPVLANIRRSLGRQGGEAVELRPAVPAYPTTPGEQVERFLLAAQAIAAKAKRVQAADLGGALQELVEAEGVRKAALWQLPRLEALQVEACLRELGVEIVPPGSDKNAYAQCDIGITSADFVVAATGTIGLLSSAERPRAVSLLPRIHLAVVSPEDFRPDLAAVFAEAKGRGYLVLVSGPSRTADIELVSTLGVHGPKDLRVWII